MLKDQIRRSKALIHQIDIAFDGVTLGDGIGLWETDGIDDYCSETELKNLRERDEKHDWRRISPGDLNDCNAAPCFLDAEGMRFLTPAFLTAELNGQFSGFIDILIYNSIVAVDFVQLLSPSQRHVIIACISLYGSIEQYEYDPTDISSAIMRYAVSK